MSLNKLETSLHMSAITWLQKCSRYTTPQLPTKARLNHIIQPFSLIGGDTVNLVRIYLLTVQMNAWLMLVLSASQEHNSIQSLLFSADHFNIFSLCEPHEVLSNPSRLVWVLKRPLFLWAQHHWAPEGYQFPGTSVKSHSAGGKDSGCPQPSTEQRWSGPCRGQTCP